MDIKAQFLSELDSIERQKSALADERALLDAQKAELTETIRLADKARVDAEKAVAKAGGIDEIARAKAEVVATLNGLENDKRTLAERRTELLKWENRLFEIETEQSEARRQLEKAQQQLSNDKATYKETLKAEFLDTVKRQLSE